MVDNKQPQPSREFLSMVIILLRTCEKQTGDSLVGWLEHFEDDDIEVDAYDDKKLRKAVDKLLKKLYPDEPKPFDRADWPEDEEDDEQVVAFSDNPEELDTIEAEIKARAEPADDEEPLPNVEKVD